MLVVDFTAWALGSDNGARSVLDGYQSRPPVDAAMWAQTLAQAGAAEHLLLVVSPPAALADHKVIDAWNCWQKARDGVLGGRWADAVGASRKVVDLLGYAKESDTASMKRTKAQRWRSLGYALPPVQRPQPR